MIGSLRLQDLRCFEALSLSIPEEGALFVGENAQGKTTLLEAVCVLVRLQSPRARRLGQLVRMGQPGFGIGGECWGRECRVRTGPDPGLDLRIDGEEVETQAAYLADGGLVVWMGNEDLELVRGPGEARRRYLDFLASQVDAGYRRDISRYRRALRARNLLLKERRIDAGHVAAYTDLLVEHGEAVQRVRADLVAELATPVRAAQAAVSGSGEEVGMTYKPAGGTDLRAAFAEAREREWRQRQTVVGPHRDDVKLTLNDLAAADFGSEGQQRTLALALKLGQGTLLQARGKRVPVYLLDDIFGELDSARRNALMAALPDGAQKLITTTSVAWWEDQANFPVFHVAAGTVG
ncbi:MAG: DNA replication and repair protein RecF [Akkermansiaceae bacterium]|nr:DNA replication and repair protein RecF [Akkermansiaceae bacterium]